jgi:hypothetical protein
LIGNTNGSTGFGAWGDGLNLDPGLGPLADNGGPTFTHALLPGSPALEAGDDVILSAPHHFATDQRGQPRKAGYHVDIGAFELDSPGITPPVAAALGGTITATNPVTGTMTAVLEGLVSSGGAAFYSVAFEYGLTTGYGASTACTNIVGADWTLMSSTVIGLAPDQTFHYRAVASNVVGISYSPDRVLVTSALRRPGDANGDGLVDPSELNTVLSNYWPQSPWLYITHTAGLGGTNVQFAITNVSAWNFSMLMSTNQTDWDYLGPVFPVYQFVDPDATNQLQRFYRLRWP